MKKVVTVSLGSSKQDFEFKTNFLGQAFSVRRMGADDDTGKAISPDESRQRANDKDAWDRNYGTNFV